MARLLDPDRLKGLAVLGAILLFGVVVFAADAITRARQGDELCCDRSDPSEVVALPDGGAVVARAGLLRRYSAAGVVTAEGQAFAHSPGYGNGDAGLAVGAGVVALARGDRVRLLDPATLAPRRLLRLDYDPADITIVGDRLWYAPLFGRKVRGVSLATGDVERVVPFAEPIWSVSADDGGLAVVTEAHGAADGRRTVLAPDGAVRSSVTGDVHGLARPREAVVARCDLPGPVHRASRAGDTTWVLAGWPRAHVYRLRGDGPLACLAARDLGVAPGVSPGDGGERVSRDPAERVPPCRSGCAAG